MGAKVRTFCETAKFFCKKNNCKTLRFSWWVRCDYTNGLAWDTQYEVTGLSSTDYTFSNGTITLTTPAVKDDIYTITANGNDVPEETITVRCL